jgi:hypothetical protein
MSDLVEFLRARLDEDQRALTELAGAMQDYGSARVLAEVEAKRELINELTLNEPRPDDEVKVERMLELLALPYADHPDWREEWRP